MQQVISTPELGSPAEIRQKIVNLEASLKAEIESGNLIDKKADCTYRHFFIPGGYAREMTAPAGVIIVGKIHRYPCFNVISKGHILVVTEGGTREIKAPCSFISEPGVKRVGVTIEETIWTGFFVTDETDVNTLEKVLIADTYDEINLIEGT